MPGLDEEDDQRLTELDATLNELADKYVGPDEMIDFDGQIAAVQADPKKESLIKEIQIFLLECGKKIQAGGPGSVITDKDVFKGVSEIAGKYPDALYGIPLPILEEDKDIEDGQQLVVADGVPLSLLFNTMRLNNERHELRELRTTGIKVRNKWDQIQDRTVEILETPEGEIIAFWNYHAGQRLRTWINDSLLRTKSHLTAEAELKAIDLLKTKITGRQFDCYMLSNTFPEISAKSGIHYFFRKGYPTLAVSYRKDKVFPLTNKLLRDRYEDGGHVLCALCMHPMGYYDGTHVGMMTPTDEVIAALLMMRADEHYFWRKSGQWSMTDPRACV